MALKLAVVRTNDGTDEVEAIHLEVDLRAELAAELAGSEARVLRKSKFAGVVVDRSHTALTAVEGRLKASTITIT